MKIKFNAPPMHKTEGVPAAAPTGELLINGGTTITGGNQVTVAPLKTEAISIQANEPTPMASLRNPGTPTAFLGDCSPAVPVVLATSRSIRKNRTERRQARDKARASHIVEAPKKIPMTTVKIMPGATMRIFTVIQEAMTLRRIIMESAALADLDVHSIQIGDTWMVSNLCNWPALMFGENSPTVLGIFPTSVEIGVLVAIDVYNHGVLTATVTPYLSNQE